MDLGKAAFLGAIQGLTEFLPVSSSGHLVILEHFLKVRPPGATFEIFLHLGTLLATLVFFRRQIRNLKGRMIYFIIVGTVPTGVIAFFFKSRIEDFFFGPVKPAATMLLVTGVILWLAGRREPALRKEANSSRVEEGMNAWDAFLVGTMQGISLIPGISRVGSTISVGLFRGLERELAARYSFLLSIPAILGANLFSLGGISGGRIFIKGGLENMDILAMIVGTGTAFLTGYFAIGIVLRTLYQKKFGIFAFYCWSLGILVLILG